MFPDGTSQVWKLDIQNKNQDVKWWFEHEFELIHLHQLMTLLDNELDSSSSFFLTIPYLPYARQDKPVDNIQTFAMNTLSDILNTMPLDGIVAYDIHNYSKANMQIDGLHNTEPDLSFLKEYDTVIFPDAGACKRYMLPLSKAVNVKDIEVLQGVKVRDQSSGYITSYGLNGRPKGKCIVIDDICDGGATFSILANSINKFDGELHLYVSHGIFSKGLDTLSSYYDKIITTNSLFGGLTSSNFWEVLRKLSKDVLLYKQMVRLFDKGELEIKFIYEGNSHPY